MDKIIDGVAKDSVPPLPPSGRTRWCPMHGNQKYLFLRVESDAAGFRAWGSRMRLDRVILRYLVRYSRGLSWENPPAMTYPCCIMPHRLPLQFRAAAVYLSYPGIGELQGGRRPFCHPPSSFHHPQTSRSGGLYIPRVGKPRKRATLFLHRKGR